MSEKQRGLKDVPIDHHDDETLGLREYADALTEFVHDCATPMTVALQGDWGSGKTSLMNLVKKRLEEKGQERIRPIWFNTWQYAQFSMEDTLALSMLSHFIEKVAHESQGSTAEKAKNLIRSFFKFAWCATTGVVTSATGVNLEKGREAVLSGDADPAAGLATLKDHLEELVKGNQDVDRFVVFIDDLDRLVPVKAVELLESLKLFMDIEKCVFILAVDYNLVIQGLREKFSVGEAEFKGKNFFDKIIQVPFNMPLTQYQVETYFRSLLDNTGVAYESGDVKDYVDLVNYSVGFNPRAMKRLFNSLLLLRLVAERMKIQDRVGDDVKPREMARMLFAILCMQNAYEPVYRFLTRAKQTDDEMFSMLQSEEALMGDEKFQKLRKHFQPEDEGAFYRKLTGFMEVFYRAIQLTADKQEEASERLSAEEISSLRKVMNFSAVVSVESASTEYDESERYRNRDMGHDFIAELNKRHGDLLRTVKDRLHQKGFYLYQKRKREVSDIWVCLYSSGLKMGFEFFFGQSEMFGATFAWYQRDRDKAKNLTEQLVKPKFEDLEYTQYLDPISKFAVTRFEPGMDWDGRAEAFREMVTAALDQILPGFMNVHLG